MIAKKFHISSVLYCILKCTLKTHVGKSVLQVPETGTHVLDNTRQFYFLCSIIVSFWTTQVLKNVNITFFGQYGYTRNVPVYNTGPFQNLGHKVGLYPFHVLVCIIETIFISLKEKNLLLPESWSLIIALKLAFPPLQWISSMSTAGITISQRRRLWRQKLFSHKRHIYIIVNTPFLNRAISLYQSIPLLIHIFHYIIQITINSSCNRLPKIQNKIVTVTHTLVRTSITINITIHYDDTQISYFNIRPPQFSRHTNNQQVFNLFTTIISALYLH